jgi:hypothetical protein
MLAVSLLHARYLWQTLSPGFAHIFIILDDWEGNTYLVRVF